MGIPIISGKPMFFYLKSIFTKAYKKDQEVLGDEIFSSGTYTILTSATESKPTTKFNVSRTF